MHTCVLPSKMQRGREIEGGGGGGRHLLELAEKDTPAFLCHFYNTYFAHSAGGKMIGTKLSAVLLDRHKLQFYQYEGGERGDKPLLQAPPPQNNCPT